MTDSNAQLPLLLRDRFLSRSSPSPSSSTERPTSKASTSIRPSLLTACAPVQWCRRPPHRRASSSRPTATWRRPGPNVSCRSMSAASCQVRWRPLEWERPRAQFPLSWSTPVRRRLPSGAACGAAGEALRGGADIDDAGTEARRAAVRIGTVFHRFLAGPCSARWTRPAGADAERVEVIALEGDRMRVVGEVGDQRAALDVMSGYVDAWVREGEHVRVGVGDADSVDSG